MDALAKNLGAIIGGVLLLVGLFAYNALTSGVADTTPPAESAGADLVKISDNISRATLSRDVFSTTGYRLLSDWSKPLLPEPTGRTNPFAPIGQ